MKKIKITLALIIGLCISCSDESVSSSDDIISGDFYEDKDVEIIFENDPDNGINVVFMGDAYLRNDLEKNTGKYRHDAIKSIDFLFNSHPFFEYKEHFNAYIVYAESSIENSGNGIINNYPFGSTPLPNTSITNYDAINDYIFELKGRSRTNKDLILMAVNNLESGSAFLGGNVAVFGAFGSKEVHTTVFSTMLHEVGHAFASLGDEYINPNFNQISTDGLANLDNTNNLNIIKWNYFIGLDGYSEVGAYEGGGYVEFGIWRPEQSSIMRGNTGSHFNAPSREAIVKKIMNLRGLDFDFEAFVEFDLSFQSSAPSNRMKVKNNIKESNETNDLTKMVITNCLIHHNSEIE